MEPAGLKLKRRRDRLKLTYRDVEQASQHIARRRGSEEYSIALSRLADIENKGTVPSIYRLYSLCAIYRLDFDEVLDWYGVPRRELTADSSRASLDETHAIGLQAHPPTNAPLPLDAEAAIEKTTFLSHLIQKWGVLPLNILQGIDLRKHRYAWIGMEDWSMYPVLQPGSLVMIDDSRRRIAQGGWTNEFDRPIYFLEHRGGYLCAWCTLTADRLIAQPHPAAQLQPSIFPYPEGIDVIGQVTGVAMLLDGRRRGVVCGAHAISPLAGK